MNLQQLRALSVLADENFNISKAAQLLCLTQSATSKQLSQLEEALGVPLLQRTSNRILGLTPIGEEVLQSARVALGGAADIQRRVDDYRSVQSTTFSIATTHTHARYGLQQAIRQFAQLHPDVSIHLVLALPTDIAELVAAGKADMGVTSVPSSLPPTLIGLPCYPLHMGLVGHQRHPVFTQPSLGVADIAPYPLITYGDHHAIVQSIRTAFKQANQAFRAVVCSADVEVMKHYASIEVGLAVIPALAYDKDRDHLLQYRPLSHWLTPPLVRAIVRKDAYWPRHMYDFVECVNPALSKRHINQLLTRPA